MTVAEIAVLSSFAAFGVGRLATARAWAAAQSGAPSYESNPTVLVGICAALLLAVLGSGVAVIAGHRRVLADGLAIAAVRGRLIGFAVSVALSVGGLALLSGAQG